MLKYDPTSLTVTIEGVTDLESQKILMKSDKKLDVDIIFNSEKENNSLSLCTPLEDLIQLNEQEIMVNKKNFDNSYYSDVSHYKKDEEIMTFPMVTEFATFQEKIWTFRRQDAYTVYNWVANKEYNDTKKLSVFASKTLHDGNECYIVKQDVFGHPIYIWFDLSTNCPFQIYIEMMDKRISVTVENFVQVMDYIRNETRKLNTFLDENELPLNVALEDRKLNRVLNQS